MFCGYAVERAKDRLKAEKAKAERAKERANASLEEREKASLEDLSLLTEVAGHLECLEPGKEISDTIVSFYIQ